MHSEFTLPEGFYDRPQLAAALLDGDFGPVFRAFRRETGWSQTTLGQYLDLDQSRVSDIENGKRALQALRVAVRVANRLRIPAGRLGFAHGVTVSAGMRTDQKGSGVYRRDFTGRVAALTFGAATGLDTGRLMALLPQAEPTGTRHVGAADIAAIEQSTNALRDQDFTQGSALTRHSAVAQLGATLPLLDAQTAPELRPRLLLATAGLATQAGWMSYDAKHDDAARRLWLIALDIARKADHPQSSDLTVYLLSDMALQALSLNQPQEALRLVHFGHSAAVSPHPVSASTLGLLMSIQARTHAALGDTAGCQRALGQALEHVAAIDPATAAPWTAYLSHTGVPGHQGAVHYELALHGRDPRAAARAVPLLRQAVDSFGPSYASLQAFYLPDLAGAHAIAGDTDTAVSIGHQAVDAITALHSPSAYDRLHILNAALEPQHSSPGVAELRERLALTQAV